MQRCPCAVSPNPRQAKHIDWPLTDTKVSAIPSSSCFPYQQLFPKDATIVQIDVRGEQLGRRTKLDYGFVGDTRATLCALLPLLQQNDHEEHLRTSREHYQNRRKGLDDLAVKSGKNPIHPQYVTRELDRLAAPDTIFTCDWGRRQSGRHAI